MQTELTAKSAVTNTSNKHHNAKKANVTKDLRSDYSAVELKGSIFTLSVLQINTTSILEIESALVRHLSKALKFFESAPVVIDLGKIKNANEQFDFSGLMQLLAQQQLIPVGVRNGSSLQNTLAKSAGLAILQGEFPQQSDKKNQKSRESSQTQEITKNESSASAPIADTDVPVIETMNIAQNQTKIVTQPVRSGQKVYAKGGDLIILAPVNHGAEIIADGNIHVYSTMRGRALAGVRGDVNASIFCQSMDAELVAIAGNFRVFEEDIPAEIKSKSVRIHLDQEQLIITEL